MKWVEVIISFAVIFQSFEFLSLKKHFSEKGIWRWSEIKSENKLLNYFDFFLNEKNFVFLLWIRLLSACGFIFYFSFPLALILFLSSLLISLRFRGSFNGGSDYMSLIILSSLCIATLFPGMSVQKGVLWYISLQVCTSYFIAGMVKLKQGSWRSGKALSGFIESANYNPPELVKKLFSSKWIAFISSWLVMLFEISFPLILTQHNHIVLAWPLLAFLFHLANVFIFGLNRFLIVWSAAYPALYFVANNFSNSP